MIVCICKAVNDRAIRRAVADGVETFDELQFELGVGTCCGKCVATACEVLCEARAGAVFDANPTVRPVRRPLPVTTRESALA